jgi:hypothetical protein
MLIVDQYSLEVVSNMMHIFFQSQVPRLSVQRQQRGLERANTNSKPYKTKLASDNYKGSAITPRHLSQLGQEHMAYSNSGPPGFWPVSKEIFGAENSFSHAGQIVIIFYTLAD